MAKKKQSSEYPEQPLAHTELAEMAGCCRQRAQRRMMAAPGTLRGWSNTTPGQSGARSSCYTHWHGERQVCGHAWRWRVALLKGRSSSTRVTTHTAPGGWHQGAAAERELRTARLHNSFPCFLRRHLKPNLKVRGVGRTVQGKGRTVSPPLRYRGIMLGCA